MADSLTTEQIYELREAFDLLDRDGDGKVDVNDLAAAFRSLGHAASPADLQAMITEVDADGKNAIDFPEFLALMTRQARPSEIEDELRASFKHFAHDGEFITPGELRSLLISLGLDSSASVVRSLVSQGDRDRDGRISWDEFRAVALGE
jgi:Ca2+-binding EF-hand superfamily protein